MHRLWHNNSYFLLTYAGEGVFAECVRAPVEMPPLGCKHGWPFEFFLFARGMKSNHVRFDGRNGFALSISLLQSFLPSVTAQRARAWILLPGWLRWRLCRRDPVIPSGPLKVDGFQSSTPNMQRPTHTGFPQDGQHWSSWACVKMFKHRAYYRGEPCQKVRRRDDPKVYLDFHTCQLIPSQFPLQELKPLSMLGKCLGARKTRSSNEMMPKQHQCIHVKPRPRALLRGSF